MEDYTRETLNRGSTSGVIQLWGDGFGIQGMSKICNARIMSRCCFCVVCFHAVHFDGNSTLDVGEFLIKFQFVVLSRVYVLSYVC